MSALNSGKDVDVEVSMETGGRAEPMPSGSGKSANLPLGLRGKAGGGARVTAGSLHGK